VTIQFAQVAFPAFGLDNYGDVYFPGRPASSRANLYSFDCDEATAKRWDKKSEAIPRSSDLRSSHEPGAAPERSIVIPLAGIISSIEVSWFGPQRAARGENVTAVIYNPTAPGKWKGGSPSTPPGSGGTGSAENGHCRLAITLKAVEGLDDFIKK
jgi:hypothetical protein